MKKFVFFYTMRNSSPQIMQTAPKHITYWEELPLGYYSGGPFSDKSGGMIIFDCEDEQKAELIINQDPFIKNNLIEQKFIKEWNVH